MFHCLAATAGDLFIGRQRTPAWHRVYRALDHGRARSACLEGQTIRGYPVEVRNFAEEFVTLQKARQQADYALDAKAYQKSEVLGYIASAELAIDQFERVNVGARRGFSAHVLFRQRPW